MQPSITSPYKTKALPSLVRRAFVFLRMSNNQYLFVSKPPSSSTLPLLSSFVRIPKSFARLEKWGQPDLLTGHYWSAGYVQSGYIGGIHI